jgi:hypothetical protein
VRLVCVPGCFDSKLPVPSRPCPWLDGLREQHPLTGCGLDAFPSARTNARPMSDAAVNATPRRMSIDNKMATRHGFRVTARTLLNEVLGSPSS